MHSDSMVGISEGYKDSTGVYPNATCQSTRQNVSFCILFACEPRVNRMRGQLRCKLVYMLRRYRELRTTRLGERGIIVRNAPVPSCQDLSLAKAPTSRGFLCVRNARVMVRPVTQSPRALVMSIPEPRVCSSLLNRNTSLVACETHASLKR